MVKTKDCLNCGKTFQKERGQKRWNKRKFCDRQCYYDYNGYEEHGKTIGSETECDYCGERFERSTRKQEYCCVSHANKHQYEEGERDEDEITENAHEALRKQGMEKFRENPTITDTANGYEKIYIPSSHSELEQGYLYMHRFVWWKKTGKLPPEDKVVHHKDGDRKNNDFENLELMSEEEHMSMHGKEQWENRETSTSKCEYCGEKFEHYHPAKYCGQKCRMKNWQENNT